MPKCAKWCFRSFPDIELRSILARIAGMTSERMQVPPLLTYEEWKIKLRKDCEIRGKLLAFGSLGEFTLKLLWENGLGPPMRAIVGTVDGQAS